MADEQEVRSSIVIDDKATKPLQAILVALTSVTEAMDVMRGALGKSADTAAVDKMRDSLAAAKSAISAATGAMPSLKASTDSVKASADGVKKSIDGVKASTDKAAGSMEGLDASAFDRLEKRLAGAKNSVTAVANAMPQLKQATDEARAAIDKVANAVKDVKATEGVKALKADTDKAKKSADEAAKSMHGLGAVKLDALLNVIGRVGSALKSIGSFVGKALSGLMDMSDRAASANAKFNLITGSAEGAKEMTDAVADAAGRARSSYTDMADAVAKLGVNAKGVFKDQAELVSTVEQMQKHFKLTGATAGEAASAMYNLTQSMSSGKLLGQDFRILKQNAPTMVKALRDALGVTSAELDDLVSKGEVSAKDVVSALVGAAEKTNAMFAKLPVTFADIKTQLQNTLTTTMQPMMVELSAMLNDESFQSAIKSLLEAFVSVIQTVKPLIMALLPIVQRVMGQITALFSNPAFQAALEQLFSALAEVFAQLIPLVSALMPLFKAVANVLSLIAPILAPIIDLVASLMPIVQLVVDILSAILPILGPVVNLIQQLVNTLMPVIQFKLKLFMWQIEMLMPVIELLVNVLATLAEAMSKVYDFIFGLLGGLIDWVRKNFGVVVDIARKRLAEVTDKIREWINNIIRIVNQALALLGMKIGYLGASSSDEKRIQKKGAWKKGGRSKWTDDTTPFAGLGNWNDLLSQTADNTAKTAKNTSKMADSLEWAKDYARQQAASRLTSATFRVDMSGMHNVIAIPLATSNISTVYEPVCNVLNRE